MSFLFIELTTNLKATFQQQNLARFVTHQNPHFQAAFVLISKAPSKNVLCLKTRKQSTNNYCDQICHLNGTACLTIKKKCLKGWKKIYIPSTLRIKSAEDTFFLVHNVLSLLHKSRLKSDIFRNASSCKQRKTKNHFTAAPLGSDKTAKLHVAVRG